MTRIALYCPGCNLSVERSISAKKKLLTGLSPCIESTAYLHTTERTVCKISAVFPCERNTLSYALVNDGCAYFCETIDIGFSASVVTTFDGVIEETIDRVIVVLIVLGCIDTTLSRNRVRAARRITDAENLYIITEFTESAAAEAPPRPVPTTMISSFLLLLGLTSLISDFLLVHFSAKGPSGIFEINLSAIL